MQKTCTLPAQTREFIWVVAAATYRKTIASELQKVKEEPTEVYVSVIPEEKPKKVKKTKTKDISSNVSEEKL